MDPGINDHNNLCRRAVTGGEEPLNGTGGHRIGTRENERACDTLKP